MIIAITHFSEKASTDLLELWFDFYKKSGCTLPVVVVTDGMTTLPEVCSIHISPDGPIPPISHIVYNPASIPGILRPGMAFDIKGSLMCQAIRRFGEVFFVDADAFFLKNPEELLAAIPERSILSMGDDPFPTPIRGMNGAVQRNAGVVVVKAKDSVARENLIANYKSLYSMLRNTSPNNAPLLEQFVWSSIHDRYLRNNKAHVFPKILNWSRMWNREDPNIVVMHEHGPQKWDHIFKGTRFDSPQPKPTGILDPSKVTGIVLAHASAKETVKRHLPYWLKVCSRVLVVTPTDHVLGLNHPSVIEYPKVPNQTAYSVATSIRTHEAMKLALGEHPSDYYLLLEYDSLCWGPIPEHAVPYEGGVSACQWTNEAVSPVPGKTFSSNIYLHFPQLYSQKGLKTVADAISNSVSYDLEHGYGDRFLGAAVIRSGVPIKNLRTMGLSYSYENISLSKFPRRVTECIEAVKGGAIFTHGIKDQDTLKSIAAYGSFGVL
jgi:hypothetical protein